MPEPSPTFVVDSIPSCPKSFNPQQNALSFPLSSTIAQVNPSPAVIALAVPGRSRKSRLSPISDAPSPISVVESNPSCPLSLPPQQDTLPLSQTAQVWSQPNAILSTVLPVGALVTSKFVPTSPDESPLLSVSPRPSCPLLLSPQQIRSLLSMTAQVWLFPASSIVAVRPVGNCMNGNVSPVSRYPSPNPPLLDE